VRSFIPQILSKTSINCVTPETPYGDNPFWQAIAHEEGNQVPAAQSLLCVLSNAGDAPRTITIPAPALHDGNALEDRMLEVPADGEVYGVLFDPAYAGNAITESAEIIDNGGFDADLSEWEASDGWAWNAGSAEFTAPEGAPGPIIQMFAEREMLGKVLRFDAVLTGAGNLSIGLWDPSDSPSPIWRTISTVTESGSYEIAMEAGIRAGISFSAGSLDSVTLDNVSLFQAAPTAPEVEPALIRFACDGPDVAAVFLDTSGNAYDPPFQPVPGA
jgi:hypothetical protein